MLTCDEYLMPTTLAEAFAAMAANRGRYRIVAGATDTLPWAREGRAGDVDIPVLIDVSRIDELNALQVGSARVRIGAATPMQRFADDQIRAQATVGGNIVNASPAADATPCLIAHNAAVELASANGRRRMPLH